MSDDSDSDFGFGSSSPFLDDDEPSTTTPEAVIDDGSTQEQQRRRQQEDVDKNKDNEKLKENKDVPSLDGEQDNEDSSTTPEAVIDNGSTQEQQQQRQQEDTDTVIVIEKNKDNEEHKENKDVPSLDREQDNKDSSTTPEAVIDDGSTREQEEDNEHSSTNQDNEHSSTNQSSSLDGEQDNEDSSTTPEAVIDDGSTREQEEDKEHSSTNQDNEHSSTNQSSWDDDENESGDDEEYKEVSSDDESEAVSSEEDDNENEEQVENKDEFGAYQVEEGCSGGMKKRRRFTLQEKLMYIQVVQQKVDKGISLWEASKSINISHKQILDWKKQSEKMKGKSNQHAKSLGDGVQSFLSPYTDRLLSFIFEMRETGMAVSVNSIVLKASQLSREFREKSMTARHSAIRQIINVHGFVHQMGTHLSQRQPSKMEEIASDFICVTREKLQMSCRDEAYIINMDQTPVPFSYDPKKTIEVVG